MTEVESGEPAVSLQLGGEGRSKTMDAATTNSITEEGDGFWARQTGHFPTAGQVIFDIAFGILMPLLCFYFDPGIISGNLATPLRHASLFIYVFSGIAMFTLTLWFAIGYRAQSSRAMFGGVLLAGAVCSISIGVIILPLTLLGMLLVIGLLGFVPFLTGFVYLRNGLRAIGRGIPGAGSPRVATIVLSAILVTSLPALAQWRLNEIVEQSMTEILSRDVGSTDAAIQRIKRFQWIVDADRIVREYERETNAARKERLGKAYKEITGVEIETRLSILND